MLYTKKKGQYGYIKAARIQILIYTIILFAVSLSVFFIGYSVTGTKANLFSIIAVLGILPAAKSLVNLIMFCKAKECPKEVYDKLQSVPYEGTVLYEMQITVYERAYAVEAIACPGRSVLGLVREKTEKIGDLEKHIRQVLASNGKKEYLVKVFDDERKFIERLQTLASQNSTEDIVDEETSDNDSIKDNLEVVSLMKDISL